MQRALSAPKTLVCPVDFSHASRVALEYAIELASTIQANVHVVHIYQLPSFALTNIELQQQLIDEIQTQLDGFLGGVPHREVELTHALHKGVPHVEVVRYADQIENSLIVMATTGKTGLSYLLLGSVAERVIRSANVPVLTVRVAAGAS